MRIAVTVMAITLGLLGSSSTIARAVANDSAFPVRISTNGRYLEDARGKPFLLHGDTAWSIVVQLTKEETEEYLENRRRKGFNAILVNLIEKTYADNPPKNKYGDEPFTTPGDFSTPNDVYFAHVDWVIEQASEKGILVVLNPCYTGWSGNGTSAVDGFLSTIIANGPTKCRNYGRYVGNRYKDFTNILWQAVGDTNLPPGGEGEQDWLEILQGIKEVTPSNHLWSAHYQRFSTALDQGAFAPFMSLDNAYGGNRSYVHTLRAYNRTSFKPTFYNEGYYEAEPRPELPESYVRLGAPHLVREQAYWAILSGATGHIFGSHHVWAFGGPIDRGDSPPRLDWRTGMDRPPSREMVYVRQLFDGRQWQELEPDQDHQLVTAGFGTFGKDDRTAGGDYITAARTSDGRTVMAYIPSTGTESRIFTLNMAKLAGPVQARWYNPTNGTYTTIDGSPLANRGSRDFASPGDNGTGTNDWVLILETNNQAD